MRSSLISGKMPLAVHKILVMCMTLIFASTLVAAKPGHGEILLAKASGKKSIAKSTGSSKKSSSRSSSSPKATDKSDEKSSSKKTAEKSDEESSSEEKPSKSRTAKQDTPTSVTTETLSMIMDRQVRNSGGSWGVEAMVMESGQKLFGMNDTNRFIPASNRKIFTAALALDQLGPDFEYRTYFYRTGNIDSNGVLQGHLVVRPQGDPTLSDVPGQPVDWIFRDWVKKAQAAGIRQVAGELLIDCSDWNMRDLIPKGWEADVRESYPTPGAMTLGRQYMEIRVTPGAPGQPGNVSFVPPAEGYPVINNTVTGGKTGPLTAKHNDAGQIELSGSISAGSKGVSVGTPCDNPTLYAAAVFRHRLHEAGIPIRGSLRLVTKKNQLPPPTTDNVIAAYISPKLSEIVKKMMKHSDNQYAEQIFVSVGAIKAGTGGYQGSRKIEDDLLRRAGIDPREVNFEDGCGLSRLNQVSPDQICKLLVFMSHHPAFQAYFDSMAIGGRDGTLRGRMHSSLTEGRVHAKTGHIDRVNCLSGYINLEPQKTIIFSFLVNNTHGGAANGAQDQLCAILARLVL